MSLLDESSVSIVSSSGFVVPEEWQPLLIGGAPNPAMTFGTFHAGEGNRWLMEVLGNLCAGKENAHKGLLFVHGDPGIGKTHLLTATAAASQGRSRLIHVADLEAEILRAKRLGALAECYQWLLGHEILIFDGMDHTADNEIFESDLIHILDSMVRDGKTVLFSSAVSVDRLSDSNPRLVSLVSSGLMIPLTICDSAERLSILREMPASSSLPEDILQYLAANVQDSVRRLKAAATQIASMAAHSGARIDLDTARAVVPLPQDLQHAPRASVVPEDADGLLVSDKASFFRDMLGEAETEAEQALALQIAISQRVREIQDTSNATDVGEVLARLKGALSLLRDGQLSEAMQCLRQKTDL